jgi:ribosomal-protein-alanine N-acetyltransferase
MTAPQPELLDVSLEGEQVLLRPVRPGDAAAAFPLIHRCEEVTRWLVWDGPGDEAELAEAYGEWRVGEPARGLNYRFAIESPGEGFVGSISLRFEGHPYIGDVGYWVAPAFWNRGLGTEANRLLAVLAFEHLQVRALTAVVFVGNNASARLLEKVGYVCEVDTRGQALVGLPSEFDRESWSFGLTRPDLHRACAGWSPRRVRASVS